MSRVKLVMLSLLAALALTAIASSTALATHEFKVNGTAIPSGSKVEVQGQIIELGQLEGEVGSGNLKVHITCNQAKGTASNKNVLESGGKSLLKAEFTGCQVYEVNNGAPKTLPCEIKEPIAIEGKGATVAENGVVEFKGNEEPTKERFGSIEFKGGTCTLLGSDEARGSQLCDVPSYGFEGDIGEVICTGTGSANLKLGTNPAKIYARLAVAPTAGQKLGWKE
jgi:hypothetical protein